MDKGTRRAALLVCCIGSFLTPFMGASVNVALPAMGAEFSASAVQLSWVATGYPLAAAMFLLPLGRLADIRGRKLVLTIGAATCLVTNVIAIFSPSILFVALIRLAQGIGAAMIFGTSVAVLSAVFPAGERGKVLGIVSAVVYSGLSSGPFVGGILTEHFGWRSIFVASIPIGAFMLLAMARLRGEWAEAKGQPFDFLGSVIYSVSLAAAMYGISQLPSPGGGLLIALGAAGMFGFLRWEARTSSPLLDVRVFRANTVFVFSNLAALINYSATTAVGFLLSLYLQYIKALGADAAGLVLVSQPILMAALSPFAGRLSDRVEPRLVSSVGMSLNCAGLALLALIGENTPIVVIVLCLVLIGIGFALFSSPNSNAVMTSVDRRYYGVASATLSTARTMGQMLSMGITMLVFALVIGNVKIEPRYYPEFLASLRIAFVIFAVMCLGGVLASLARGKLHPDQN